MVSIYVGRYGDIDVSFEANPVTKSPGGSMTGELVKYRKRYYIATENNDGDGFELRNNHGKLLKKVSYEEVKIISPEPDGTEFKLGLKKLGL